MQGRPQFPAKREKNPAYVKSQQSNLTPNGPGFRLTVMRVGPEANRVGVTIGQALRIQSGEYVTILKKHGFIWSHDQSCYKGDLEKMPQLKQEIIEVMKKFQMEQSFVDIPLFVNRYLQPMSREFKFRSKVMDSHAQGFVIHYEDCDKFSIDHAPLDLRMRIFQFQKEGIEFSLRKHGRVLIGDEMGVGKTIQALGVAAIYKDEWPVLILCPSSLKYNWRKEACEWLKSMIQVEDDIQVIWKGSEKLSHKAKIVICSYDLAKSKGCALEISQKQFQVVICDEAHNLKSVTSERSKQLVPLIQKAKRVIMLTGTPAFARPVELFPILACIRPDVFTSYDEFGNRYGEPTKNPWANKWEYKGSSCVNELHHILKTQVMIRRLKKDVLSQLPPKHRQVVDIFGKKEIVAQIKALTKKIESQGKDLHSAMEIMMNVSGMVGKPSTSAQDDQGGEQTESTQFIMTQIYNLSSEAKIDGVTKYLSEAMEGYDLKIIIFAYHQNMLDAIQEQAKKLKIGYIRIDGRTKAEERGQSVSNFQTDPKIKWAILSITAASVGLTLTASHTVVFAELYWTPAIIFQAEDRAHRISQVSAVNCYYLVAKDTIDQAMFDMIQRKSNLTNQLLDGGEADELTFTNMSKSSKTLTILDHFGSKVNGKDGQDGKRVSQLSSERFTLTKEHLAELEELEELASQKKPQLDVPTEDIASLIEAEIMDLHLEVKPNTVRKVPNMPNPGEGEDKRVSQITPESSQKDWQRSPWSQNNQPDASWGKQSEDSGHQITPE